MVQFSSREPGPPLLPFDADEAPRPAHPPRRQSCPCFVITLVIIFATLVLRLALVSAEISRSGDKAFAPLVVDPEPARAMAAASAATLSLPPPPPPESSPPSPSSSEVEVVFAEGTSLPLRITLRPDLSASSADFWREAATLDCRGQIYRSEGFLMQGRIACAGLKTKVVKGSCPQGVKPDSSRRCPAHDPQCGCHGPIMTPGMVGWAGGGTGPDFFVYTGQGPASHWAHDHTIIGTVDERGMQALAKLHGLPASTGGGGMTMLRKPVPLSVRAALPV